MLFLFFFFLFTKLDQMSRVGSRARHPKCRAKNSKKFQNLLASEFFIFLILDYMILDLSMEYFSLKSRNLGFF